MVLSVPELGPGRLWEVGKVSQSARVWAPEVWLATLRTIKKNEEAKPEDVPFYRTTTLLFIKICNWIICKKKCFVYKGLRELCWYNNITLSMQIVILMRPREVYLLWKNTAPRVSSLF